MRETVTQGLETVKGLEALIAATAICCALMVTASSALAATPTHFGEKGSGAGEFNEAAGAAVEQSSGDVYIADRNNNRIDKFDKEGHFLLAWGWGVADGKTEALQTCTTTCLGGRDQSPFEGTGAGQFALPEGVAVDNSLGTSHGDVYVLDPGNHRIQKFKPNGEFLLMFGGEVNAKTHGDVCLDGEQCQAGVEPPEGTAAGPGEFKRLNGRSVAVGPTGDVYVGDENRIQRFSPGGVVEPAAQISLSTSGFVEDIAVDSTGDVYVKSSRLPGVRQYDAAGTKLGEPRDELGLPEAITLGAAGELFVDDREPASAHHIIEYDSSGTQLSSFDAGSEGSGGRGIAYGENLNVIYVLNQGAVRLVTPPPPGPLVLSTSAEAVEPTSAALNATVNPEGPEPASYHFEYGTSTAYGESTAATLLTGGPFEDQAVPLPAAITGLQTRTTYHFRVVLSNGTQTTDGPDQTFTTLPPVLVDSESATQVSASSARLDAQLNPLGLQSEYHFEFGLSSSYEDSAPVPDVLVGSGHGDVSVGLLVQGLSPNTTYHYRVVARNSLGSVEGEDHTFTTSGAPVGVLPDGRAWEMVSPQNKQGVSLEAITEEGGVIQAAEDGGAVTYIAKASIEANPAGNRSIANAQVISKRGPDGWSSKDITTAHESVAVFLGGSPSEYKLFSGDLSAGIVEPLGATPLSPQTTERTPYRRESASGEYVPLVTAANAAEGVKFGGTELAAASGVFEDGVEAVTASPDLSHIILASPQPLTAGFVTNEERSLFELSGGKLQPVSILPGGESTGEAGVPAGVGDNERNVRGAVSSDGRRIVFETGGALHFHLYQRDTVRDETVQLDVAQPGVPAESAGARFQAASADGSKVFFTDTARLTSDSTAKEAQPDLYECEVSSGPGPLSCTLSDLSVDSHPGESANVQERVLGVDEAGRYVYFAANGALAPGASAHECHEAGGLCNLYVYDTVAHQIKLVATLASADASDWDADATSELGNLTARSSPDGRYLAFMSQRSLTGFDNTDVSEEEVVAGEGKKHADEEVYLYDAQSGETRCVSCNRFGARPAGIFDRDAFPGLLVDRPRSWRGRWLAASIPGWTLYDNKQALYQSRYLSNSGRLFFNSQDSLVPQDANGKEDVYQYEPDGVGDCDEAQGCQSLISSGSSDEESAFLDASASGDDVFFLTASKLSSSDIDSGYDIYDAHVCTSESPCPPPASSVPPPCTTADSCRVAPSAQPSIFGLPASATFNGSGNVASPAVAVKPKAKPLTRAQKLAGALKACRKKAKSKRSGCEKQARKKYGPVKKAKKSAHNVNRRAR